MPPKGKRKQTDFDLRVQFNRIQNRQRKRFGDSQRRAEINASHAREMLVRKVILPELRSYFGKSLKAVLIFGTVQHGVRRADPNKWGGTLPSDVDVVFVLDSHKKSELRKFRSGKYCLPDKEQEWVDKVRDKCENTLQIPVEICAEPADSFREHIEKSKEPFQTISGKRWIESSLGKENLHLMKKWKKTYLRSHPKSGPIH